MTDDDETKLCVRLEKFRERLSVKLVVAEIERGVDGLEGLKVKVDFFLFALVSQDGATIYDEAVGRGPVVELEPLLCRRDGSQD
jgi:hypothetical protein